MKELFPDQAPRAAYAELALARMGLIEEGAVQIGGEGATVAQVFELPPKVRDEAPDPNWDEEQERTARALGHVLNYAAEFDVPSGAIKSVAYTDGGKVWKIQAEIEALVVEPGTHTVVISGSPHRLIGNDEKDFKVKKFVDQLSGDLSQVEKAKSVSDYTQSLERFTEYDEACEIADSLLAEKAEAVLPFGYELNEENSVTRTETGQFIRRGRGVRGQNIITMKVEGEVTDPETGKYKNQPEPTRRLEIVSDLVEFTGDTDSAIVFMTSNAYAERQADALRAGLTSVRRFFVNMYGRRTLARVKNEEMLPGARLNQLPGAIRLMYEGFKKLYQEAVEQPE